MHMLLPDQTTVTPYDVVKLLYVQNITTRISMHLFQSLDCLPIWNLTIFKINLMVLFNVLQINSSCCPVNLLPSLKAHSDAMS